MVIEGKYLIVGGTEDKAVHILVLQNENTTLKCIGKIELNKRPSCIAVHPTTKELWIGDKFGDVYGIDFTKDFDVNCTEPKVVKQPAPKMGHLAMLTGMIVDEKYIISSDRDEKIRVTNYPEYYVVHNFCLGHTEMVSSICLATEDCKYSVELMIDLWIVLVSASTDKTLKVWKYLSDADDALKFSYECGESSCPHVVETITLGGIKLVLVLYENSDNIQVLQLNTETAELTGKYTIPVSSEVLNFRVTKQDSDKVQITLFTVGAPNLHLVELSIDESKELKHQVLSSSSLGLPFSKEDLVLDNIYSSLIRKVESKKPEKNDGEEKQTKKHKK